MLRRIMIIFATAGAVLALATTPAGAGAGGFEVYSETGYGGTHASVPSDTVQKNLNQCVSVSSLTGQQISVAQSVENFTAYAIKLYNAAGCGGGSFITTVGPNTVWAGTGSLVLYVKPTA